MNPDDFRRRTKAFALQAIRLTETLPKTTVGQVLGKQLVRSATSVGANYRSAARAKSRADFIAKMAIVEEECDESLYWLELLADTGCVGAARVRELVTEGNEILALVVASIKTARLRKESAIRNPQSAIKRSK